MAVASSIKEEEYFPIALGQGMYTSELSSNIPDGYSAVCYNMVATGDSLENRTGIKKSSVDWKVFEASPGFPTGDSDDYNFFCHIDPWSKDSSKVAFMWGAKGAAVPSGTPNSNTLNFVRAYGVTATGDGFMSVNVSAGVTGITQYGGSIYFALRGDGVKKITSIDWAADSLIHTAILSSAGGTLRGLFTFKDRLWGFSGNSLYFTNIAAVGGQPETWAFASNVIKFIGPNGVGIIQKVVPLGNRLAVFTTNGLFTLLVEGAPASWILRILDSKSISTVSQCAFESKGIIYYINTQGVWATNTQEITNYSGVIEDQFFLAKGSRLHTICQYEDGMVISVVKQATGEFVFDKENCKTFYSKLNPVGWTEWNFNSYELGTFPDKLAMMWSMTDKIPTYLNAEPTVYVMAFISDSTEAANVTSVAQLLIMDGGVDQYSDKLNNLREIPVGIYLKTKSVDGGNQFRLKTNKKAMLELYTSDAEHNFVGSWDIDVTTSEATEIQSVLVDDFTVGIGSNLIQIRAGFPYRRCAFNFRASLQAATSQIKIKNLVLAQDTLRSVGEQVG